jgi:hypothetical protein
MTMMNTENTHNVRRAIDGAGRLIHRVYPTLVLALVVFAFFSDLSWAQRRPLPVPGRPGTPPPTYGGGGIPMDPPNPYDQDDRMAYDVLRQSAARLDCNSLANMVDDISLRIHYAAMLGSTPPPPGGRDPESIRRRIAWRVRERLRSPGFTRAMWYRVTRAYSGCGRSCFDNGEAMGLISGSGYCTLAVALGGTPGDHLWPAPTMTACGHQERTGCETGYRRAAESVPGCWAYASGDSTAGFLGAVNQDCAPL